MLRKTVIFFILLAGLLLSACVPIQSADTTLELKADEQWVMQVDLEVAGDQSALVEMGINEMLSQGTTELQAQGITTEYTQEDSKQEGNTIHRLSLSGQGYNTLNDAMFGGASVITVDSSSGDERISFVFDAGQLDLTMASAQSFTLKGGKVISSNGVKDGSKAVRWDNPSGTLQALMEPPGSFSLSFGNIGIWELVIIFIILILLAGLGVGAFFLIRHLKNKNATNQVTAPGYPPEPVGSQSPAPVEPQSATPPVTPPASVSFGQNAAATDSPPVIRPVPDGPPKRRFCPQCGTSLPDEAVFCPSCGRAR